MSSALCELRRGFDNRVVLTMASAPEPVEKLLLMRVAGDPHTLRASELSGLNPRRRIVPPAGAPVSLLGSYSCRTFGI
jgi:hypothetical protein